MADISFPIGSSESKAVEAIANFYWNNSVLKQLRLSTVQGLLAHLSKLSPTFFKNFGEAIKPIPRNKVGEALKRLAEQNKTSYPSPYDFFNAVSVEAGKVSASEIKSAVRDTVEEIGSLSLNALKITFFVALLVGAVVLYQKSGGKFEWKHA